MIWPRVACTNSGLAKDNSFKERQKNGEFAKDIIEVTKDADGVYKENLSSLDTQILEMKAKRAIIKGRET